MSLGDVGAGIGRVFPNDDHRQYFSAEPTLCYGRRPMIPLFRSGMAAALGIPYPW